MNDEEIQTLMREGVFVTALYISEGFIYIEAKNSYFDFTKKFERLINKSEFCILINPLSLCVRVKDIDRKYQKPNLENTIQMKALIYFLKQTLWIDVLENNKSITDIHKSNTFLGRSEGEKIILEFENLKLQLEIKKKENNQNE